MLMDNRAILIMLATTVVLAAGGVSPKCAIGSKVQAEFGDWSVKYGAKVAKISGNIITVDWDDGGTTDREVTAKRVDDTEGKSCFVAGENKKGKKEELKTAKKVADASRKARKGRSRKNRIPRKVACTNCTFGDDSFDEALKQMTLMPRMRRISIAGGNAVYNKSRQSDGSGVQVTFNAQASHALKTTDQTPGIAVSSDSKHVYWLEKYRVLGGSNLLNGEFLIRRLALKDGAVVTLMKDSPHWRPAQGRAIARSQDDGANNQAYSFGRLGGPSCSSQAKCRQPDMAISGDVMVVMASPLQMLKIVNLTSGTVSSVPEYKTVSPGSLALSPDGQYAFMTEDSKLPLSNMYSKIVKVNVKTGNATVLKTGDMLGKIAPTKDGNLVVVERPEWKGSWGFSLGRVLVMRLIRMTDGSTAKDLIVHDFKEAEANWKALGAENKDIVAAVNTFGPPYKDGLGSSSLVKTGQNIRWFAATPDEVLFHDQDAHRLRRINIETTKVSTIGKVRKNFGIALLSPTLLITRELYSMETLDISTTFSCTANRFLTKAMEPLPITKDAKDGQIQRYDKYKNVTTSSGQAWSFTFFRKVSSFGENHTLQKDLACFHSIEDSNGPHAQECCVAKVAKEEKIGVLVESPENATRAAHLKLSHTNLGIKDTLLIY